MLSDRQIRQRCMTDHPMIVPFEESKVRGCISFGVSSYGYDIRTANRFMVMTRYKQDNKHIIIDPKNFDPSAFEEVIGDHCLIPPNSFALAETVEQFCIPRDILTICLGKSTYARCGIIINVTPFEPEWLGVATLEISNTTPYWAKIYANEGIGQLIFLEASDICQVSYADKKGRYQSQTGITLAEGV